jgi:hypothetical protein
MKKNALLLLLALLVIVGNMQAQEKQYQIHYVVNMHNISDSTALYQRIATNNASEPYILGDIVRWMHCNRHRYNEPVMIAEREFGLYKDKYVTVTIDGEQYFISGYDISGIDASGYHWVEKSLPKRKKGLPWGKILLFGIGGILLLGWLFGARGGSSSHSGGGSSSNSYRDKLDEIERAKREKEREEAEKRRKEEQERQAKWREQLKREGKW